MNDALLTLRAYRAPPSREALTGGRGERDVTLGVSIKEREEDHRMLLSGPLKKCLARNLRRHR